MGKDLRTTAVVHKLHRLPKLDGSAWSLRNPQPFLPSYQALFKTDTLTSPQDYGIKLSDAMDTIVDADHVKTTKGRVVQVHRKTTMILSPFKWMRGDYNAMPLPKPDAIAQDMHKTLQSPHTAAYVGALSSILLSESGCIHFPKVYGVYAGLAGKHTIDISDDYEELSERKWFLDNLGKTFELKLRTGEHDTEFHHTRSQRPHVMLGDETALGDIEDVDADHVSNPSSRSHASSYATTTVEDHDSMSVDESEDAFEIESCDCESEDGDDDDTEELESFAWATFTDVPVITTVMERCEGTFYDLIKQHPEPEKHSAWVAQIVMALAFAQRTFGFAHNDLHGNNVMYVPTTQEFLYYKHNGVAYRIPTHGYIMKIIDFDRAIVSVRLAGMKEPRTFVSSQFQPDEEAAGQYNVEPFMVQTHPHIPASSSFDLARFATSMFWDMFPKGPDQPCKHPLLDVFQQWMLQSDGTSVMFRKQRDNHDRYHGFHLYKAITRYCKNAVPRREITKLTAYQIPQVPVGVPCLFIES